MARGMCNTKHLNLGFKYDFRLCRYKAITKVVTKCYPYDFEIEIESQTKVLSSICLQPQIP